MFANINLEMELFHSKGAERRIWDIGVDDDERSGWLVSR